MSVSNDHTTAEPRLKTELEDGREVDVEISGTSINQCRVDVRVDRGRHWVFGVNDDVAVLLMTLNSNGQRVDDELPAWIEPLVRRIGLVGIEQ